ncbi:MAG: GntR family transcriptional regulator [Lachnospiraceae bacterium]|nr:GntR family transcriptional regulator [Lachnospiraceae bacterium]
MFIDYQDARPIYEQIVEQYKKLILMGALTPDEQMPSVRSLAVELSTNPNTVQKAYSELERQGFIYTVKGRGAFVQKNERLVESKKEELIETILALASEAEELGMTKEEIRQALRAREEKTDKVEVPGGAS